MKAVKLLFVILLMAMPNTIEVEMQINPDLATCIAYDVSIDPNLSRSENAEKQHVQ